MIMIKNLNVQYQNNEVLIKHRNRKYFLLYIDT